jgi:hypothetical protein
MRLFLFYFILHAYDRIPAHPIRLRICLCDCASGSLICGYSFCTYCIPAHPIRLRIRLNDCTSGTFDMRLLFLYLLHSSSSDPSLHSSL